MQSVPPATEYVNGESREGASRGRADSGEQPLVTTPISEHRIEIYPRSVRVVRPGTGHRNVTPPDRSGSTLTGFSTKSRSRLRFAAVNAFPSLCSQLGLTYHQYWPTDGRESKRHLHAFLITLHRLLPSVKVLWLLEFQRRNAPHYHLFLTVPPDRSVQDELAAAWVRITGGTPEAFEFHRHQNNWIDWHILNGGYLCKYLDKEAQKSIPDGYSNFGRFWGCSRDLVPAPIITPTAALSVYDQIDSATGEVCQGETYLLRNLGRLADRQTKGFSRFRQRAHRSSYMILNGADAIFRLERYLSRDKSQRGRRCLP